MTTCSLQGYRASLLAAMAALLLALAVASASANNLSISNQNQRIVWSAMRFISGSNTIACHVTLEGSFHRATTAKVVGTLLGYITRATFGTCTGGSATVLSATLPWHMQYAGFTGMLPTITSVLLNIIGMAFALRPEASLTCLARTEANHPFKGSMSVENGTITEFTALVETEIPLIGEGGLCSIANAGHSEGSGRVTVLSSTTAVSIRLI